jgi:hypothetical protein
MNPDFRRHQVEHKPDPECRPKELIGSQPGKLACRKEHSDDWPDCRYRKSNGERSNHPLAMHVNFVAPDMPEGFPKRE